MVSNTHSLIIYIQKDVFAQNRNDMNVIACFQPHSLRIGKDWVFTIPKYIGEWAGG